MKNATRAVLNVGDGRGFVVEHRSYIGHSEKIVITAAHCLPFFPPSHPAAYLDETVYPMLLGPLWGKRDVAAQCLFADPMADIAVLGQPDNQALSDEADAYDRLMEKMVALAVADAPKQGAELLTFGDQQIKTPTPGKGVARVMSLEGHWCKGRVERRSQWLAFEPTKLFVGGMSGSPIVDSNSAAIGVVSVAGSSPVILDSLATWLVRSITSVNRRRHA
jgi:hypothetical protein